MRQITTAQIRKIHALARERGMDEELLHYLVEDVTKKSSIKNLTIMEAVRLIDVMEGKDVDTKKDGATGKQMSYLIDLAKKLGWITEDGALDADRLNGMCSKYVHIDDYRWLTRSAACKIIEALKQMLIRQPV